MSLDRKDILEKLSKELEKFTDKAVKETILFLFCCLPAGISEYLQT